jgi:hypothetical protein
MRNSRARNIISKIREEKRKQTSYRVSCLKTDPYYEKPGTSFYELWNRLPVWKRINLSGTPQNPIYHPEIWVDIHIQQVFDNVVRFYQGNIELKICALFHDIAKDDVTDKKIIIDEKTGLGKIKYSSLNHEILALPYIDKWKHLYSDFKIDWYKIKQIVRQHIRAHEYISGNMTKSKQKEFRSLKYFDDIIAFEFCDKYKFKT